MDKITKAINIIIVVIGLLAAIIGIIQFNLLVGILIIVCASVIIFVVSVFDFWWPIVSPPYPKFFRLFRLHLLLRRSDWIFSKKIRKHLKDSEIDYLQPLVESCKEWGDILSLWRHKIKSPKIPRNRIRWTLLSDIYLHQEIKDFENNEIATGLDLYAKVILLNFYLTVDSLGQFKHENPQNIPNRVIWVVTRMLPTDWPLCNGTCNKKFTCLSGNSSKGEEDFLRLYMDSLRACASLKSRDGGNLFFCRHILISKNQSSKLTNKFRREYNLAQSLQSHRDEYHKKLHRDVNDQKFSDSYKILIPRNIIDIWPDILNDAVFYGCRDEGSQNIKWEWAICTTYTPQHPSILLQVFDLQIEQNELDKKLNILYQQLGLRNGFTDFAKWVESTRQIIS